MAEYKTGERLRSRVSKVNVIVVRAAEGLEELTCGGVPLARMDDAVGNEQDLTEGTAIELGKRYENAEGTVELLCVAAGIGELALGGSPLTLKSAKPLPASD